MLLPEGAARGNPYALLLVFLFSIFSWKCGRESPVQSQRVRITLNELTVVVRDGVRSFFLSDKRGGFLVGSVGSLTPMQCEWSVLGRPVVTRMEVRVNGKALDGVSLDSTLVTPDRVVQSYKDGTRTEIAPFENMEDGAWGLAVSISFPVPMEVAVQVTPAAGYSRSPGEEHLMAWRSAARRSTLVAYAGPTSRQVDGALTVAGSNSVKILLSVQKSRPGPAFLQTAFAGVDASFQKRVERMEGLLNRGYLRTSDELLNRAVSWTKLSLDALMVEGEDTFAVASLPWDGSFDGRMNLQALPGLVLASGRYQTAAELLRAWAKTQDDRPSRQTYGRIARLIHASPPVYDGADVSGLFVRGLYDYVVATNDTALAEELYPVVRRSVDGTKRYHADRQNFLRHGAGETWMNSDRFRGGAGPFAAVEVQALWQFEQLIGTFVAQLAGDTVTAKTWGEGALATSLHFAESFVDTGRRIVYDHLDGKGRGVDVVRPNGLLALDGIEGELIQQALIRRSVRSLLYVSGPGTLAKEEAAFRPAIDCPLPTDGAIATWLTGPFVYAVTRNDRPDIAYRVTTTLARHALEEGMVGTLPAFFSVGAQGPHRSNEAQQDASLMGMAEFVRTVYQDYLGIRVDAPSSVLRFEPKLPPEINAAEFTVYMGDFPIVGSYLREKDRGRFTISLPDLPRPVKWRFIWTLDKGDAWIGSLSVHPGSTISIVAATEGILAYEGEKEMRLDEQWFVRGFSKKNDTPLLRLADFPK